jgi:DNA-binding CsgD family transcriptional regulator
VLTFERFVEQSQQATTTAELRTLFQHTIKEEGFDNCFVGTMTGRRATRIGWAVFPEGHFENYLAERWYEIDPILTVLLRSNLPFVWDDVVQNLQLSQSQTDLLDECKRVGVHSIIMVPFLGLNGHCDVVSISRRVAERPDPSRIPILKALCTQVWYRYADLAGASAPGDLAPVPLTERELEVLRWMKDGKSNVEISEIVTLSTKTVEYHVGNILRKLGASNRTTAVVIAIRRNLLPL